LKKKSIYICRKIYK